MELTTIANSLYQAVAVASKFTTTIDSISNSILITASEDGRLHLLATDMDQVCSVRIGCVVEQPGYVLVPTRQAKAFSINADGSVRLRSTPSRLELSYQTHTFRANIINEPPDFFPEHNIEGDGFQIRVGLFDPARGSVDVGGRPALECVYLIPGEESSIIAADGFVASRVFTPIPIEDIAQISGPLFFKAISAIPGDIVVITVNGTRVRISSPDENIAISFPMVGGISVPDWNMVFGHETECHATFPPETVSSLYTICSRTAEADTGAYASMRSVDGGLRITVDGYAESDALPISGDIVAYSQYSKFLARTLKYFDLGKDVVIETARFEGSDNARFVYIKQESLVFFISGSRR